MTNEERDALIAQGWTPPVAGDPDLAEATILYNRHHASFEGLEETLFTAIKRGRALAAEAKPGMVWKKWDGSEQCPVKLDDYVWSKGADGGVSINRAGDLDWMYVTHYAIITPPEDAV